MVENTAPFEGVSAYSLKQGLQKGEQDVERVAEVVLSEVQACEPKLQAFASLEPQLTQDEARRLDDWRRSGRPIGPLHGIPFVLSDVVDTRTFPTGNGTPLDDERRPVYNSDVADRLQAAGALLIGKTTITELGAGAPPATRHPQSSEHRPGHGAAGAASAVAAGLAPVGLGLESVGSTLRPAAYCGLYGLQPSAGSISRRGILSLVPTLDNVSLLARSLEDLALFGDVLYGYDPQDPSTPLTPPPHLLRTCLQSVPVQPTLAFVDLPFAPADDETQEALMELESLLGPKAFRTELPPLFEEGLEAHRQIVRAELAKTLRHYLTRGKDQLSEALQNLLAEGAEVRAQHYLEALDWITVLRSGLEELFRRCDALVVPAAFGTAPSAESPTEIAQFQELWNLCGLPVLGLPLFQSSNGLPLGLQLIGPMAGDARLLRTARWLETTVREQSDPDGEP